MRNTAGCASLVGNQQHDALEEKTDDELMLLTRGGAQRAFDVLVHRHQARVLRVASRYLRDRTVARDVAQSALLAVFGNRQRYAARGKFIAYLCRITINQCRMAERGSRFGCVPLADVGSDACSTDAVLLGEYRRDLERAIAQLSEKLKTVVTLRYGADLELAEIADALELPIGTVKRRLFDAMAKLRQALENQP